jgi:hypothetical protein
MGSRGLLFVGIVSRWTLVYFQLGVSGCLFPEVLVASAKFNETPGAPKPLRLRRR